MLRELGVKPTKQLPAALVEQALEARDETAEQDARKNTSIS
jgi:hypothetical protein